MTSFLVDIANLDFISTEQVDKAIYYLPEKVPISINFAGIGIESTLLISNIGLAIWIIFFQVLVIIFSLLLKCWTWLWQKLSQKIYFNAIIRVFMQLYQEIALLSLINIFQIDFESPYRSERYSNMLSIVFITLVTIVPAPLLIFSYIRRNEWNSVNFRARYGTVVDGLDVKSKYNKLKVVAMPTHFFLRRICAVLSILIFQKYLWSQIVTQFVMSFTILFLLQGYSPLESRFENRVEIFNEMCILNMTYMVMLFTDYVPDAFLRY